VVVVGEVEKNCMDSLVKRFLLAVKKSWFLLTFTNLRVPLFSSLGFGAVVVSTFNFYDGKTFLGVNGAFASSLITKCTVMICNWMHLFVDHHIFAYQCLQINNRSYQTT